MSRHLLERTTTIAARLADVFTFFAAPENLGRLTPPAMRFRILDSPGRRLREGDRIRYSIRVMGLPIRWTTRIVQWRENESFADVQERGPYRYWHHTHTFREVAGGVEMRDLVEYELPFGVIGDLFGGWLVRRQLRAIFDYRASAVSASFPRE